MSRSGRPAIVTADPEPDRFVRANDARASVRLDRCSHPISDRSTRPLSSNVTHPHDVDRNPTVLGDYVRC